MNWTDDLQKTVSYIETHILDDISADTAAGEVHISPFYLQKGFRIMTGYTIAEYIRNRRLYLSALDMMTGANKVIDVALKYGYDTPESFTKAFSRFHGVTPMQIRSQPHRIKTFLPLKITVTVQGGNYMDYSIEKISGFKVIGFSKQLPFDGGSDKATEFWGEIYNRYIREMLAKERPETDIEKAVAENGIGDFGISVGNGEKNGSFRYFIAGSYNGGRVPEGMEVYEIPDSEWAKFSASGPIPSAIQTVYAKVFSEWLPSHPEYEVSMDTTVEWYSKEGSTSDIDYQSAVWLPIRRK